MRKILVLLSIAFVPQLKAQTVFEHPAAIPAFGGYAVEARSYGVVAGLPMTGIGVVWDLSTNSYTLIGTTVDSILVPSSTPYASDYPDATHVVRLVDQFGYYRVTTDRVDDLGYRISPGSPSFIYSDPARILEFPSAVGDAWSDPTLSGTTANTLTVTILAEGEIRLNDRIITDAVLVRRAYVGTTTATSTTWFRKSDGLRPLGNVLSNGGIIVRALELDLTMGADAAMAPRSFSISPVPTFGPLRVASTEGSRLGTVILQDMTGRVVLRIRSSDPFLDLDLADLSTGAYSLTVLNGTEHRSVRVLISR